MKIFNKFFFIMYISKVLASKPILRKIDLGISRTLVYDGLIEILDACKTNNDTIAIFDNPLNSNYKWLLKMQTKFSVIIQKKLKKPKRHKTALYTKIDAIVFVVQANMSLGELYVHVRKMISDDIPPVYILSPGKGTCGNFHYALLEMWRYKIMVAYFLCPSKGIIRIYTYNPFINQAPGQWKFKKYSEDRQGEYWAIYIRKYKKGNGNNICEGWDFDRTKILNGFEIPVVCQLLKSSITGKFFNHTFFLQNPHLFVRDISRIMEDFAASLNVTFKIYDFPHHWNKDLKPFGDVKNRIYSNTSADIIFIHQQLSKSQPYRHYKGSYPVISSQYGIVTYHKGYQTSLEKILDFYGMWTILFTTFVLLATFFVIWLVEHKKPVFAIFEIIRLLINHSLQTRMNRLSMRIFFSMIFIYFLVIQATFHGHLAEFLTKPELRKHAETLAELNDSAYSAIYDEKSSVLSLAKSPEERGSVYNSVRTCITHILNNERSAVCINDYKLLRQNIRGRKNLYINKNPFGNHYKQFAVYNKWPLKNRFDMFIIRLWEFGIQKFQSTSDYNHRNEDEHNFRPIKLKDLTFIFIVLGIGLLASIVSFCIEVYTGRKSN